MTTPIPPATPIPAPAPRTSKAAITSLITGLLSCIPFLGLIAILTGILGIAATRKPGIRGRGLAITGLILGLLMTCLWTGGLTLSGGIWGIWKGTEGPRVATHDFLNDVANNNIPAASARATPPLDEPTIRALAEVVQTYGKLKDTTFTQTKINNNDGHVSGTATFTKPEGDTNADVEASLHYEGNRWKVKSITVEPPGH